MPAKKIIECVPNFSEGRDKRKIEKIVYCFKGKKGVTLLDYESDEDHNRSVITLVGEPTPLKKALIESIGVAIGMIDMRKHKGGHPRMGAVDVVPFIPIKNITMDETVAFSKTVAKEIAETHAFPVFLYEASATDPHRKNLSDIRKGQFENMAKKMAAPEWKPDFGPDAPHPSAGVTAVGARMPLVAFNVNLATDRMEIADAIARRVRHVSGGLRYCKAIGVNLKEKGMVQVSMNLTDYTKTPIYQAVELIKVEARRYGVSVAGSEIIGMVPAAALVDTMAYYLGIDNLSPNQLLEIKIADS